MKYLAKFFPFDLCKINFPPLHIRKLFECYFRMDDGDESVDLNVDSEDESKCRTRKEHAMFLHKKRRRRLMKVLRLIGDAKVRVYECE